jgi:hypothetical protein
MKQRSAASESLWLRMAMGSAKSLNVCSALDGHRSDFAVAAVS